jgi:acyl transferase domain-containing protein
MEPIAVVGFAFKLPGGANSTEKFWEIIESGRNVSKEWPRTRLNIESFHDVDPRNPNSVRYSHSQEVNSKHAESR